MEKQKVNFLRPLYWFCLIPFWFALRSALYFFFINLGLNVLIPFTSAITSFIIFLLYLIYLKFSGKSFSIKFERINVVQIIKCLCVIFINGYIIMFLEYYSMRDLVYLFKSLRNMSFSNILTKPVLPEYYPPVGVLLIGPICEELLFRHAMYNSMKQQSNSIPIAIVYSSIIFSLVHYNQLDYDIFYAIDLFISGLLFAYCYEKTHNILSSIILHSLANVYSYLTYGLSGYFTLLYFMFLCGIGLIVLAISLIVFLVKRKRNAKIAVVAEEVNAVVVEDSVEQCSEVEAI